MTNAEKFEEIFGLSIDARNSRCFAPVDECTKHSVCIGCPYNRWATKEYVERNKPMYVERTFDSIKEAGDYITNHGIDKKDIIAITLHNSDNGITLTFTTEAELDD